MVCKYSDMAVRYEADVPSQSTLLTQKESDGEARRRILRSQTVGGEGCQLIQDPF